MGKHTPGPWTALCEKRSRSSIGLTAMVNTGAGKLAADFADSGTTDSECIANAKLASLAPELLEACKQLVAAIESISKDHPNDLYLGSEYRNAVMVIDRAEGY